MVLSILMGLSGFLIQIQPNGSVIYLNGGDLPGIEVYDTVYRIDLTAATVVPLFENSVDISRVEQSKDGRRIILEGWGVYSKHVVDVIDESGNHLARINNAVSATFIDPDGKRLAYAKGVADERHRNVTQGTWIHFLETGEEEKIYDDGEKVVWLPFNNALQISSERRGSKCYDYNLESLALTVSTAPVKHYSPGGALYWTLNEETHTYDVWERESVRLLVREQYQSGDNHIPVNFRWISSEIAILTMSEPGSDNFLLLPRSGVRRKSPGYVLAASEDESAVYYCGESLSIKKVTLEDLESVEREFEEIERD